MNLNIHISGTEVNDGTDSLQTLLEEMNGVDTIEDENDTLSLDITTKHDYLYHSIVIIIERMGVKYTTSKT
jgi:hypothetical protein